MPVKKQATSQKKLRSQNRAPTELDAIEVRGASEHNLKSIDVTLPKKKISGHHRRLRIWQIEPGL